MFAILTIRSIVLAGVLSSMALAQDTMTLSQSQRAPSTAAKPADPKISPEERERAIHLLDASEAQARSFEAPLRAYMLYQIAQAYVPLDKTKPRPLFRDAFTATLDIRDDDYLKQQLQDSILTGLLPISQADVEELMQQAEPQARKRASTAIAKKYLAAKKFDRAVELVQGMTSWTEFPYDVGSQIMAALPEQMNGDFRTLFTMALNSYQTHEHKDINLGGSDFGNLVAKFGTRVAPRVALDAIDEILKQAKKQDDASISVSGDGGIASFNSAYQFELFQLLPVLRKLDPGHAKALLDADSSVKALGNQYPNGMQSLNPEPAQPSGPNAADAKPHSGGFSFDVHDKGSGPSTVDQMAYQAETRARQLEKDSETDPIQAIAQTASLPAQLDQSSPRAQALLGIAKANVKKNPIAAKQALDQVSNSVQDLKPMFQVRMLVSAAKTYLDIDDPDGAQKICDEGFKLSEKMLVTDNDADDPNKALKAYWPSVETYRLFLDIETKISPKDAIKMVDEIQDPEMQDIERVMLANALLGNPMKTSIMMQKTKHNNSIHSSTTD